MHFFSVIVMGISEGKWCRKWEFFGSREIWRDQSMEKNDDTSHKVALICHVY